jgi:hypothetical protein
MPPPPKYFIDAHCRFFNIANAAIGRINLNKYKWFAPAGLILLPFIDLNKIIESYKDFIGLRV